MIQPVANPRARSAGAGLRPAGGQARLSPAHTRRRRPAGETCVSPALPGPERAEVHSGVAWLPAAEETLDRRMDDDLAEVVQREQAGAANGDVVRLDVLERAVREIGG